MPAARARLSSAGGLPEVFTTAHDVFFTQAGLRPGEHLLVHGGAGGVGSAAVQLARRRCAVTATVRRGEPREHGAARCRGDCPRGLRGPRPLRRRARAGRRPEPGGQPERARNRRADRDHRRRRRREGGAQLARAMGKRARIHGSTSRARPLRREGHCDAPGGARCCCRCSRAAVTVPVAASLPSPRPSRRTSASRRAASSARSFCCPSGAALQPGGSPGPRGVDSSPTFARRRCSRSRSSSGS